MHPDESDFLLLVGEFHSQFYVRAVKVMSSELASLGLEGRVSDSHASSPDYGSRQSAVGRSWNITRRFIEEHNVELPTGAKRRRQRNGGGGTGPRGFSVRNSINRLLFAKQCSSRKSRWPRSFKVILCSSWLSYISNTDSLLLNQIPVFVLLRVIRYRSVLVPKVLSDAVNFACI